MNCLNQRKKFRNKHPAWEDANESKSKQFKSLQEDEKHQSDYDSLTSEDDEDYELVAGEVRSKKISLESKELKFKHLVNINNDRSFNGQVKQVKFHPNTKMALVTLTKGQVDLFEIDGERNRYLQNIKIPYARQPFCAFNSDGSSIVISSSNYHGHFFVYDIESNSLKRYALKSGYDAIDITNLEIHGDYMACRNDKSPDVTVLSTRTYETLFSFKLNERPTAIKFTTNNNIFIAGENSRVYIWDVRKPSLCKHIFHDQGTVHTTSMCLTETSELLSLGSDCGIVNSYELNACLTNKFPNPVRTFTNLNTPIDILRYNHSGELLFMASSQKVNAFRMVHSHSGTVYKNFPYLQKNYGHLFDANFSPLSGYLALGCSRGRAHLCRIPYYKSY